MSYNWRGLYSLRALYESLKLDDFHNNGIWCFWLFYYAILRNFGMRNIIWIIISVTSLVILRNLGHAKPLAPKEFLLVYSKWLEKYLQHGYSFADTSELPHLICKGGSNVVGLMRKILSFYSLLCGSKKTGKKLSPGVYCNFATGLYCNNEELMVLVIVGGRGEVQPHIYLDPFEDIGKAERNAEQHRRSANEEEASKNSGTIDLRHFGIYAFAGRSGLS